MMHTLCSESVAASLKILNTYNSVITTTLPATVSYQVSEIRLQESLEIAATLKTVAGTNWWSDAFNGSIGMAHISGVAAILGLA